MVPAHKILTVTYGTFSCTLEGFEDPFSAMTEIAEYFRDLAAKDRYFGAEPPTPDMGKLEQIAAASIPGSVKADNSSGRLVLRPDGNGAVGLAHPQASDADTAADMPAAEAEVAQETVSTAPGIAEDSDAVPVDDQPSDAVSEDFEDDVAATDASESDEAYPADADDVDVSATSEDLTDEEAKPFETAADRLARLRDVSEDEATVEEFEMEDSLEREEPDAEGLTFEDAAEDGMPAELDTADIEDGLEEDIAALSPESEPPSDEEASDQVEVAFGETSDEEAAIEDDAAAFSADADLPDLSHLDDSADVSDADAAPVEHGFADHDAIPEDMSAEEKEVTAIGEIAASADDEGEEAVAAHSPAPLILSHATSDEIETHDEEESGQAPEEENDEDTLSDDLAALFTQHADEDAPDEATDDNPASETRVTVARMSTQTRTIEWATRDEAVSADADDDGEDDEDADLMAELAAIESELARDATGANLADDGDDDEDDAAASLEDQWSDEDDEELLMRELAEIQRDAAVEADAIAAPHRDEESFDEPSDEASEDAVEDEDDAETAEDIDETEEGLADGNIEEAQPAEQEPSDLERLFAATDSRLSGEDASRRHANISHLKAAVAARRADDTIETARPDQSNAYRADLASTVRPRRPTADDGTASDRSDRKSPLVLISEQRVEVEDDEADQVAAEAEVDIAEGLPRGMPKPLSADDFEKFAEEVGAVDLPDVLEAAAVFSGSVMGQETFSRPRLLHLAAEAVDDLSREDGLRGFGQLLRDGTIRKVGRGTFTLGTDSRFQARAPRRAG